MKSASKIVGVITNEIVAEHPEYPIDRVFEEAGNRTREMLGLKQQIKPAAPNPKPNPKPKSPAFASQKAGGSRGGQNKETKTIVDEIEDLL